MRVLGIVVEYNPFHNGHIYHIQQAKQLIQPDYTIAVMSSSFVQRGEPAIISKWDRAKVAVAYGVDLVIELPFVYVVQSADYFAKGAIMLLEKIGCTDLVFGSEDGNIDSFIHIAKAIKDNPNYETLVKENMKSGLRYADATNKALSTLLNKEITTPNDLLGLAYVKEIVNNDYNIRPHCIKRTNNYHDEALNQISSATAIRKALSNNKSIGKYVPNEEDFKLCYRLEDFYPYLCYLLKTTSKEELASYHLVDEGLENKLLSCQHHDMNSLIQGIISKRYTLGRIQRMIIHILLRNTKEEIQNAFKLDYIRVLKMNDTGRNYLNKIKKECDFIIVTNFFNHHSPALEIELKATKLLSLLDPSLQHKEYKEIVYIKEDL